MVSPDQSTSFLCHKAVLASAGNQFFRQTLLSSCYRTTTGYSDGVDVETVDHIHLPDYTATQVKELVLLSYGLVFNVSLDNCMYTSGDQCGGNVNPLFNLLVVKKKRKEIKVDWKMKEESCFLEEEFYQHHMPESQKEIPLEEEFYQNHILESQQGIAPEEDFYQNHIPQKRKGKGKRKKSGKTTLLSTKKTIRKKKLLTEMEESLLPVEKLEDDEGQFTCHVCGLEFTKKEALNYHIKRNHENPEGFKCPKCPRMLKSESGLKYHMNIHDGLAYSCHVCPKVLKSKHGLAYHMNIHNNAQAFLCNDCGKSFVTKQKMQNHVRAKHTMERPYVCDTCGIGFVRSDKLLIHKRRVHTGERPYSCQHCDWRGVDSSDLIHHRKKHLKTLPSPSKIENQSFPEQQQQIPP